MINESYQVTFGVEFEFILAFHETTLRTHLQNTNNDSEIVKDIPDDIREALNSTYPAYLIPKYMGWGLTTPLVCGLDGQESDDQEWFDDNLKQYGYRGYGGEILTLAKSFLPTGVRVHDRLHMDRCQNFDSWHLTQDPSLVGLSKEDLLAQFERIERGMDDPNDWDSHGIELVSRILPFEPASFDEIEAHLIPLRGTEKSLHTALISENCGIHVHVGLPTPKDHVPGTSLPTFDLPTLQHLAYILVMYEKHISTLFPKSRREGGSQVSRVELVTNLDSFIEEPTADDWDDEKDNFDALNSETSSLVAKLAHVDLSGSGDADDDADRDPDPATRTECPTIPFANVRAKIFAPDMTIEKLATMMGGTSKGHLVNWTYIARVGGEARTLEFRQHEGTMDVECVRWWVVFVVGMVRLAEFQGRVVGVGERGEDGEWRAYGGEGYRVREWSEGMGVGDLMELMGLMGEGRRWFEGRVEVWK